MEFLISWPCKITGFAQINPALIPNLSNAIAQYEVSGDRLEAECRFGEDPLANSPELLQQ